MEAVSLSDAPFPKLKVRALVIISILNSYIRRSSREARVIGALLGEISKDGTITVTDCFAVLHTEKVEDLAIAINQDYFKAMYAFHRRNNKKEVIVGWYGTTTSNGEFIVDTTSLIHDFFSKECDDAVHLVVDSTLSTDKMSCRGYVSRQHTIGNSLFAHAFQEIFTEIEMSDSEATCVYHMINGQCDGEKWTKSDILSTVLSPGDNVVHAIRSLSSVLDDLQRYVDAVVAGEVAAPSREVGIAISEALTLFSNSPQQTELQSSNVQTKMQDLLMVSYLSSLTQTQAMISEKLNLLL